MIKLNKYLLVFGGLIIILGASSLLFLEKLIPFARHASYSCQSFINSFSIPKSHYVGAIPFVIFSIFLGIAVIKVLVILVRAYLLKRKLKIANRIEPSLRVLLEKLKITDQTNLVKNKKMFAFCMGIRNPKIYLSTTLVNKLSSQELEAVLRHERYHLNNRDTLTMLVASFAQSLLPFFPLLSDFIQDFRIEREIKADAESIKGLGSKKPLIGALKKLLSTPSIPLLAIASIGDQETLEPRIKVLFNNDAYIKLLNWKNIIISLCSAFVIGAIAISPVQAYEVHHQGRDVMMICTSGESCFNSCTSENHFNKLYSVNPSED
jgi:beta-lactamase regulating signal transducer with metallopeptidase domain